ncbi:carboxypeptidase Y-deficient [Stygiomarasmius scandens]|uniref:Carboxypeptidase Y-deficient n=1 Tax=Marasmiellus scandens TaxID=2682957 RepID=A0ABR1J494_9AGAR
MSALPYQTYKSKRHSRHLSGSNLPNGTPPNTNGTPPNGSLSVPAEPNEFHFNQPMSPEKPSALDSDSVPTISTTNGSATNGAISHTPSPEPPILDHDFSTSTSPPPPSILIESQPAITSIASSGKAASPPPSTVASSSTSAAPSTSAPPSPRRTSTFRRVPRNVSASRPASISSAMDLSRRESTISSRPSSVLLPPTPSRLSTSTLPVNPSPLARDSSRPVSPSSPTQPSNPIDTLAAPQPQHPPTVIAPQRTSSLQVSSSPSSTSSSTSPTLALVPLPSSQVQSPSRTPNVYSRPTSQSPTPRGTPSSMRQSTPTPYRPGFQPKGVYRPRTDEFLSLRRIARDGPESDSSKRIERTKLERRLEKLIALHFPEPGDPQPEKDTGSKELSRPQITPKQKSATNARRRTSSFFEMSMDDIRKSVGDNLLRSVLSSSTNSAPRKSDIRNAEQRITPWEEDADVPKCRICMASFHPITNRKHHCRLCGRIVCSLPPTPGFNEKDPSRIGKGRAVRCSTLFVVEGARGQRKIEEVDEGVDYGVRRRKVSMDAGSPGRPSSMKIEEEEEEEKFLKGVRICRDCKPVLLRQQYLLEMSAVPTFARLYEALITLEKELEDSLPQFQELVLSLNKNITDIPPQALPTHEATVARKRLLELFAQYDALSKRIRSLPCKPGSSQDRVQLAVMTRANFFLQQHMFPLQAIPKQPKKSDSKDGSDKDKEEGPVINGVKLDPSSELSLKLQPLLEQELLLESFVEEATAHRKFEDAKTLRANLGEIRMEIEKIVREADLKSSSAGQGKRSTNGKSR